VLTAVKKDIWKIYFGYIYNWKKKREKRKGKERKGRERKLDLWIFIETMYNI
jgi:hypothetical protein